MRCPNAALSQKRHFNTRCKRGLSGLRPTPGVAVATKDKGRGHKGLAVDVKSQYLLFTIFFGSFGSINFLKLHLPRSLKESKDIYIFLFVLGGHISMLCFVDDYSQCM